jgi:V/A-type H+/Na+-transporting ATPase subunit K
MDAHLMNALGQAGAFASIAIASIGTGLGTGAAGSAAIGAWKKCYAQNKPAPFQLVVFAGAPLSQTIYGMILMFVILGKVAASPELWPFYLVFGILSGLGLCISSWMQGVAGAAACDAFGENEKGFVNYLMVIGIIETVSIFVMAFGIVLLAAIK